MGSIRRTVLLSLQIAEHNVPFVLCLNMSDEAKERETEVDPATLSSALGIPVVATSALRRWNLERLKREAIHPGRSTARVTYPQPIEDGAERIVALLREDSDVEIEDPLVSRGIAMSVLAGDETLRPLLPESALESLDKMRADVQAQMSTPLSVAISNARVAAVDRILGEANHVVRDEKKSTVRDWLGIISMHPIWGVPFLGVVLYIAYVFVGKFGAGDLVDLLETYVFESHLNVWIIQLIDLATRFPHAHAVTEGVLAPAYTMTAAHLTTMQSVGRFIHDLFVGPYGIVTMALTYAIAIVLPVVITFFLFFGVLEDSGYLPRLAVMLNRVFKKMGLNGKAVLPMVLGLGCDTMATLTTRILETKKEATIVTLLLALGVPCSAQLGVILAMLGSLSIAATSLWLCVTIGTIFLVGWAASKVVPGDAGDFILEIPPIRVPKLSNIMIKVLARTEWYLKEAVPLFIIGTLLLYVLDKLNLLVKIQNVMSPLIVYGLGLPAEATNAFLIGFLRRDYGAAGLYKMQTAHLLNPVQTVVALTVITLFIPCVANFLVMLKERGTKMGLMISVFIMTYAFGMGWAMNFILKTFHITLT
jgi:ferrous iron transport protein B